MNYIYYLIIAFFSFLSLAAFSQPLASFSSDTTSGCTPLHIEFTNLSSAGNNVTYLWTFGNGNSSTEKDPVATYSNPGVYTVVLTVTDNAGSSTDTATITVYKSPVADFATTIQNGCVPVYKEFNDVSTIGDGNIVEWSWNFYDGSFTNSSPYQLHYYSIQGNYSVSLVIRDENGCTSFKEVPDYIKVSRKPIMSFYANPSYGCAPPFATNFVNYTTGNGALSFNWDFGDNTTSTLVSPSHTYNNFGTYDVSLTATDSNNCSNTATISAVKVAATEASFIAVYNNTDTLVDNDIICPGNVFFYNTTPGNLQCKWLFGDGSQSSEINPIHYYFQPGNFTVTLIAGLYTPCPDTSYFHIKVDNVKAQFSADTLYTCEVPFTVTLTNQSINAQSWIWNFGNGETDSTNSQVTQITYTEPQSVSISLSVTSPNGCTSTATTGMIVNIPEAKFHIHHELYGCKPLNLAFTDSSVSTEDIVLWEWFFGDGDTSHSETPYHSYISDGEFEAYLVITNEKGCKDTSLVTIIKVGKPLHPNFSVLQTEICNGDSVNFTDLTTPEGYADSWHYDVPGHKLNGCPYDPNASLALFSEVGLVDISLSVGYNGCFSDTIIQDAIKINGPIVSYSYKFDCDTPNVYNFTGYISGAETFSWNFGDGSPLETSVTSPTHTYSQQTGDFNVLLIANNQTTGCVDSISKTINVRNLHADFSISGDFSDTVVLCKYFTETYECNSQDEFAYCHEGHIWDFGDDNQPQNREEESIGFAYFHSGIFHPKLYVQDVNGCRDTATKTVKIYALDANFTTDVTGGCTPLTITCTNLSTTETSIDSISWLFGGGTLATLDSVHTYQNTGSYLPTLTIRDTLGCLDSYMVNIVAANPNPQFNIVSSTKICAGDSVRFYRVYNSIDSLIWDFGDNTLSNDLTNPIWHVYADSGFYRPSLHIFESGCEDSLLSTAIINVQDVTGNFFAKMSDIEADTNCYPLELIFTYNTIPNYINSWYWDFGVNNGVSNLHDSVYFSYNYPGNYTATLSVTTTNGCHAKDSMEIVVKGPVAQFTMTPDTICKGSQVSFFIHDTLSVFSFEWDFGDGVSATGDAVSHVYNQVGTIFPALIFTADSAHTCDRSLIDTLYIHNVVASFNILDENFMPDTADCPPFSVNMVNSSIGDITANSWYIDNIYSTSALNTSYTFTNNAVHTISLMVESSVGCNDTLTKEILVFNPNNLNLANDTFICEGNSIQLIANSEFLNYFWTPSTWLSDTTIYNPYSSPEESITYYVSAIDMNGCTNEDSIYIYVQHKPNIYLRDTTVIIGEPVYVDVNAINGITYTWSPSEFLNCSNCSNPTINVLDTTMFYVTLTDNYGCFIITDSIKISIKEGYTVDLPVVFTPNGDGNNDIVYVRGWGIKELNEYKIFNRWGQVIFETTDIKTGWDGTYLGKVQNSDSYIYNIVVTYYSGNSEKKVGYINLIR